MGQDDVLNFLKANNYKFWTTGEIAKNLKINRGNVTASCRILYEKWGYLDRKILPHNVYMYKYRVIEE